MEILKYENRANPINYMTDVTVKLFNSCYSMNVLLTKCLISKKDNEIIAFLFRGFQIGR